MPRAKKVNTIKAAEDCGWTDSRYMSFIRSTLRRSFTKFPTKHKVKNEASRPYKGSDKRRKKEYQCAVCSGWFADKEVAVDHIVPCGSLKTYEDLPKFVATLFCEKENLQIICNTCHQIKTNEERANR
jgi:5-methylcytosine-specific restriction endonuclease McrA